MLTLLPLLASSSAHALGGSFAGGPGLEPPASSATQVAIAEVNGRTTLTVTAQAAEDMEGFAYLWPAEGYVQGSLRKPEPEALENIEAFTRPRVESLTCNELVETLRYRTPPGCASYEVPIDAGPARGEDAVDEVALDASHSRGDFELEVVDPVDVDAWLDARNLGLTAAVREGLQPFFDAGTPLIAVYYPLELPRGGWLPPVRFEVDGGLQTVELPLQPWAREARTNHEVTVYTLHDDPTVDPEIVDLPLDDVASDCQLPAGVEPGEWWAEEVSRFRGRAEVPWVRVYASLGQSCAPCTAELLRPVDTADLGAPGADLATTRVGRLFLRYVPEQLTVDPQIAFTAPASDTDVRWIERRDGLGFVFPTCRQDTDPLDVCPDVQTPLTRGCSATPGLPWSLGLGAMVALALLRRRRALALGGLLGTLAIASSSAHAVDDGFLDRRPLFEGIASLSLAGTDRVRLQITDPAGPAASRPFVGVQGRWAFFGWKDGANLGLAAGVRGWSGRPEATGDLGTIRFTMVEPSLGLDIRHGLLKESGISPFFRYGARIALPVVDPDTSAPQVAVGGLFHVGGGAWVGKPTVRAKLWPVIELRLTVVPRTDGFVTTYHPALELPSFTFFPGTANLELLAGVGFR